MILQCKKFIDLNIVFKNKETRRAIAMFQNCIDALMEYIRVYILVSRITVQSHLEQSCSKLRAISKYLWPEPLENFCIFVL